MEAERLVAECERMTQQLATPQGAHGVLTEAKEFLRIYAGERSSFYTDLQNVKPGWRVDQIAHYTIGVLAAFARFVKQGLMDGVSIERRARIDVVSDFLEQAQQLLNTKDVHPAAPAVLVGASLEEFLRTWIEDAGLGIGSRKPSIDAYASALREAELISKQDMKDITSWGGVRNHAAHGEWAEVADRSRVRLMLEGVNLFMRKYAA